MPKYTGEAVNMYWEELQHIPWRDSFTTHDTIVSEKTLAQWSQQGLLALVDKVDRAEVVDEVDNRTHRLIKVYRLRSDARRELESFQPSWTLPCGHRGFINLGGNRYECGYDRCDAVHSRDVVEAAISDDEPETEQSEGVAVNA